MTWDSKLTGNERRELAQLGHDDPTDPRPWLLDYAGLGWHVFPTLRKSKRPLVHWPTEATTSLDQIEQWIEKWPGCGWAVNVGMSQLWVVDCDSDEGMLEWCNHVLLHPPVEIVHCVAQSGGGGYHYYYRDPFAQGVQSVRRFGEHFDTRAAGGYVVVPPTLHESGRRYKWMSPPTRNLPRIPAWVVEEWHPRSTRPPFTGLWTCGRGEGHIQRLLRATGDDRERELRRAAMLVGRLHAAGELEAAVLGDLANAAITRGLPHDQAYEIARKGFEATKGLR